VNLPDLINKTSNGICGRIKENYIDVLRDDHILIEINDLVLGEIIGQGNFGCVFNGVLSSINNEYEEVALKILDKGKFCLILMLHLI
jgi:hypothetical protein